MKKKWINEIIVLVILMFVVAGCSTTGGKGASQGSQGPTLTAINITDNKLNIAVDKPFTYTVYKSADPYKVIVELPDVRMGIPAGKIKSDKEGITEVTPSQEGNPLSTKLEILLSSPVTVEPVYKDTSLTINIKEEPEAKATAESPVTAQKNNEVKEEKPAIPALAVKEEIPAQKPEPKAARDFPPATSIVKISIEKSADVLKVVIKGNGSLTPNVFRLDNRAVLDMQNVGLTASVPSSVPLPLKNVRAAKHKDKTRVVLDIAEGTVFDVAAIEDSVIVSFRLPETQQVATSEKASEAAPKTAVVVDTKTPEGKYKGQKISLDFQDADIGPIFRLLADISGYNFVIDPSVKGRVTMKLMNVPWDQALDIILQTFSFNKRLEGNIMWIAPTGLFAKIDGERAQAKDAQEKLEDLVTETIDINYATAAEISGEITQAKLLSSRGSVTANSRLNSIIVKDTQKSIDKIRDYLKRNDRPKDQVIIEAKIVEVSSSYSETLGIKWTGAVSKQHAGIGDVRGPGFSSINGPNFSVNTPLDTIAGAGGVMGLSIGNVAGTTGINLTLQALESIGKSKRLSNPKVLTLDNKAATIQQGVSIPVSTVSAEGTKTEYVNATLSLSVTPRIIPNTTDIELQITATNNALGILTPQGYAIETKSVNTNARIKSGDTLVIGGIYTTNTAEGEQGIPLLSRIPFLGWLFKTQTQTGPNVTELLVFITPVVVGK